MPQATANRSMGQSGQVGRADLDPTDGRSATREPAQVPVEVTWTTINSPVGELLVAATGSGLVRVAFEVEGFDQVLEQLAGTVSPQVRHSPDRLTVVTRELREYFAGNRQGFALALDWRLSAGFRGATQRALPRIDYGRTVTYSELATLAGRPSAVRAAATACATNPLPIVVPCHRVIRSDATLGGYRGGLPAKQWLLDLERGAAPR